MRKLLFLALISLLTTNLAFANDDKELGIAVGLAAAIKCSVEKNYISEVEEVPLLEYYLEENNVSHLREYLSSDKGQTITRILASGHMDENCELIAKDRKKLARLNKLILFYAPE